MRGSFVDRLMARVDGALAPIWISQFITTDAPPSAPALRRALAQVVAETDRLRIAWDPTQLDWVDRPRSPQDVDGAVRELAPAHEQPAVEALINAPLDLSRELPVRLTLVPLLGPERAAGRTLLALQVHHAVADARSLMFLNRRLWQQLAGQVAPASLLGPARFTDRRALAGALRRAPALQHLTRPATRILSRRGHGLSRRSDDIGGAMLVSVRARVSDSISQSERSGLFFGAVLAAVCARDAPPSWRGPLRLRVPVDLRRELGLGVALENGCSAVPVELTPQQVSGALAAGTLAALVPQELGRLLREGVAWSTLLEVMAVSRLASAATLREHVRPELIAPLRANSLVTTYVGTVDRYFEQAPFPIHDLRTQTPTWGGNGLTFRGELMLNLTGFQGLWTRNDLVAFAEAAAAWLRTQGLAPEVMS